MDRKILCIYKRATIVNDSAVTPAINNFLLCTTLTRCPIFLGKLMFNRNMSIL